MFDFRYHALSLVAVFLALAIGLLLGVAIGDEELVSSAERRLREDVRQDVREARAEAADLRRRLQEREALERDLYPAVVDERLAGLRIVIVGLGRPGDALVRHVESALEGTGARLAAVAGVRLPPAVEQIAERADGTRYQSLPDDPALIEPLGRRLGRQLVLDGQLVERLRGAVFDPFSGALNGAQGIVLTRDQRSLEDEEEERAEAFERGLIAGMTGTDVPVVGAETTGADPSQVGFFEDRGLPSVDNVDDLAGRVALVYALGGARGTFGVKDTADALLPRNLTGP